MKYYKFKKIKFGLEPIVEITYKTWWRKLIIKHVIKDLEVDRWVFLENGRYLHKGEPIEAFYKSGKDVYWVNQDFDVIDDGKVHGRSLEYWKKNADEYYVKTPISVLKYITCLEEWIKQLR